MKSVLISVQPKWCEKITHIISRNGTNPIYEKSVEIRKTRPKINTPFKVYIYCTQGDALAYPCLNNPQFSIHRMIDSRSMNGRQMTAKEREESDYTFANGKVIGEFVCDRIQTFESEFVDDDCYESIASLDYDDDGDVTGFIEWSNDCDFSYEHIDLYEDSCVKYEELKKYIGLGFNKFYGWHISELVIYDKPKELNEFVVERYPCLARVKRPPQSWCYVEEEGAE